MRTTQTNNAQIPSIGPLSGKMAELPREVRVAIGQLLDDLVNFGGFACKDHVLEAGMWMGHD